MRLIYATGILLLFTTKCKLGNSQGLRIAEVYHNLQIPKKDGALIDWADSVKVIYHQNFILFQVPYTEELSFVEWDSLGEPQETLIGAELKHQYFIYRNGDSIGFSYKSLNDQTAQEKRVDTFLNTKVFGTLVFYDKENYTLVETQKINDTVLEKYIPKIKFDYSYGDSMYYYFSDKLKNLDYTLSKELDSLRRTKLFRVVSIYNSGYDTTLKAQLPRHVYTFEIRPTTLNNTKQITEFFDRFAKWYSRRKTIK